MTLFGALRIPMEYMDSICEHLAMNGYTYDTNGENVIFIFDEEISYVKTILKDRKISYEEL